MNLRDLFLRIRALVAPRRVERELDEELAFHIERETQKHIAAGLSPADARTRARARFGPVPLAADQCRDARGTNVVDDLARDILYAFRTFRRAPLTAITIVATVALGLGLIPSCSRSTTSSSFVSMPCETRESCLPWSGRQRPARMRRCRSRGPNTTRFDARPPCSPMPSPCCGVTTRIDGRPVTAALVTGNFFPVLGVHAALGRSLMPDDDERSAGRPVIVLSHRGWNKLFAGDPLVIGRSVLSTGCRTRSSVSCPMAFEGSVSVRPTTGRHSRSPGNSAMTMRESETRSPSTSSGG